MNFTDFLLKTYELNKELFLSKGIKIKTFDNYHFIIKMIRSFNEDEYNNFNDIIQENMLDDEEIFEIYCLHNNIKEYMGKYFYMELFTFFKSHENIKSVFTTDDFEINDLINKTKINLNQSQDKIEELIFALDILTEDDIKMNNIVKNLAKLLKIKL